MLLRCVVTGFALSMLLAHPAASHEERAGGRSAVLRDVEGYAIATCLLGQPEPFLREQGQGWASVIVERGHGDIEAFVAVAAAVKARVAEGDMAMVHDEASPRTDKRMPVFYCGEIIDTPSVRAAIDAAVRTLAPSYR